MSKGGWTVRKEAWWEARLRALPYPYPYPYLYCCGHFVPMKRAVKALSQLGFDWPIISDVCVLCVRVCACACACARVCLIVCSSVSLSVKLPSHIFRYIYILGTLFFWLILSAMQSLGINYFIAINPSLHFWLCPSVHPSVTLTLYIFRFMLVLPNIFFQLAFFAAVRNTTLPVCVILYIVRRLGR